ncbi:PhzF family phenazine biosynthesis protein [Enterococcus silesiacus]|uniref:Phenazine biosynthesis PhzF family protein n=1 Tax=Enterococcus silesiacus TaxID=332949 RepID=A0A0S3K7I4_9ENTE|nr:PhzF family phenazine biosynthesis protein [Enterococcus silesiacus]ALS00251.1 PhzF family phenazine biosynthesis protein [Enterococcus silesiacus]OJG93234.1 phenazine biosynthesis PhzF family protein [Enterococcus silesiacus]
MGNKESLFELSSFTYQDKGGNLAGVKLLKPDEHLSTDQMQLLAKKLGYAETAFVHPVAANEFEVRYFTPQTEVPLCGHATIAAFSLLKKLGKLTVGEYTIQTQAGRLAILIVEDDTVFMEQTLPVFFIEKLDYAKIASSLGIAVTDFSEELPLKIVSTGLKDLMIPVKDTTILQAIKPNSSEIEAISKQLDIIGYHVFVPDKTTISCRNFAPFVGIEEEYATGTSNGALVCYLFQENKSIGDKTYHFRQGRLRPDQTGRIIVEISAEDREIRQVFVGGKAMITKDLSEMD